MIRGNQPLAFVALAALAVIGGSLSIPATAQDQQQQENQQARKRIQQMHQQREEQRENQKPNWQRRHGDLHQNWNHRRNEGTENDDQLLINARNALQTAQSALRSGNRSGAQQALNTAITDLKNGQRDYGGHRAIALGDVREALKILNSRARERSTPMTKIQMALDQIKMAILWDQQHPGQ